MTADLVDPPDAAVAVLGRVLSGLADLAAVPAWQVSDDALAGTVAGLDQVVRLASAHQLRLAAEAGARGLPARGGHSRLEHWLREQVPAIAPRVAAAQARRAERLFTSTVAADLAPTRVALLTGRVSVEQADVVARTVEALVPPTVPVGVVPDVAVVEGQAFLLEQARTFEPGQLNRLATHLRHRLDPDADDRLARDEKAQHAARTLTLATSLGGMVHVDGLLTPACGAALRTAIDAWSAPLPESDGTPDPRTAGQRRHDALGRLAEIAITAPGQLPSTHGSPYRIVVTVPHDTITAAVVGQSLAGLAPATLPDGTALSSTELAALTCHADVLPILTDQLGDPLDVGATQRLFPPKQRAAITHRDQHCTYPGCQAPPPWCDVHHLIPFSEGGATAVTNGALLCGRHHRHVHATAQTGSLIDGQVQWDRPGSTDPPASPPHPTLNHATRLLDALTRRWRPR